MEIAATLAQSIVVSMKEIINQELNFINTNAIIIASTDESRIGEHHAGAKRVIETKNDLIVEYDGQYVGTKKGINIPIYSDQNLVGVVGITGDKDEVEKYGKIIRTMTEILVKDAWIKDVSFKKRDNYRIFIEELLAPALDFENIQTLANVLEINLDIPRIVVVGRINNLSAERNEQIENVMNLLKATLTNDKQTIYNVNGPDIRILFRDNLPEATLHYQLDSLIHQAEQEYGLQLHIGMGLPYDKLSGFRTSYEQAVTALDWAILNSHHKIEHYSKLNLGMILTDISRNRSNEFIHQILGELDKKELKEYAGIISVYGTNNGSIYKSADELFIHKNTLQYKLNKLHKSTGYNPRDLDDYTILSLAFKLYSILNSH